MTFSALRRQQRADPAGTGCFDRHAATPHAKPSRTPAEAPTSQGRSGEAEATSDAAMPSPPYAGSVLANTVTHTRARARAHTHMHKQSAHTRART
jgi:hypothetical protein